MTTTSSAPRPKPGPLLPTLLDRVPLEVLRLFRMADDSGAGGQGGGGDGGTGDGGSGSSGSGDGGQQRSFSQAELDRIVADRLTRERAKYADHDSLRAKAEELDRLKAEGQTEQEKAVEKARKDADTAARTDERQRWATRILHAELKAAAGGRFADPADALRLVDLEGITVADDGTVDDKAITKRLEDLLEAKPYLAAGSNGAGTAGGGTRGFPDMGQGRRQGGSAKPSVATGAALYADRHGKKTT